MKETRIGVFICHCGGNISDYVEVEKVRKAVENEPSVVLAKTQMFACSDAAQEEMIADIRDKNLDGIVVASCSPKLHLYTFRAMSVRAGLNPYRYAQSNIREQCSWAHRDDRPLATDKAIRLVRAGIAKARLSEPLTTMRSPSPTWGFPFSSSRKSPKSAVGPGSGERCFPKGEAPISSVSCTKK
jgi:heterodisulfide reductase subunit A